MLFPCSPCPRSPAAAAGCWAQEPDARPTAAALYDTFQAAAARFEPPPGTDAELRAQAAQQQAQLRDDKLDRLLRGQEAMHADVRKVVQVTARISGAVNALVGGEVDCFRLFWLVPAAAGTTWHEVMRNFCSAGDRRERSPHLFAAAIQASMDEAGSGAAAGGMRASCGQGALEGEAGAHALADQGCARAEVVDGVVGKVGALQQLLDLLLRRVGLAVEGGGLLLRLGERRA